MVYSSIIRIAGTNPYEKLLLIFTYQKKYMHIVHFSWKRNIYTQSEKATFILVLLSSYFT